MARMMDSLILNEFPPYAFTKITTTHRPVRTSNGMTTTKLLAKSTANIPSSTAGNNNTNNNNNINSNYHQNNNGTSSVASVLGMNGGLRQTPLQKSKVPMQGVQLFFLIIWFSFSTLIAKPNPMGQFYWVYKSRYTMLFQNWNTVLLKKNWEVQILKIITIILLRP